ncbi:hypothetical protein VNG_2024H [Halobacterium salinarum NRC-1]|uniref:Uncharacterized protein n=2 Tax=Halobacterium salinarum TaxID=2242 RepID=Q9HNN2_HALSA|nr:hypothetical protein VNG_2024H [Halobacterium salinarum NRC-1]
MCQGWVLCHLAPTVPATGIRFRRVDSTATSMDDALQRRLDRLTVLGVGLLVAVVSLGLTTAGEESLVSLVSVLAVAGVAAVLLSSATD